MSTREKFTLLVVFDPTTEEQPALERAGRLVTETTDCVHLFAAVHGDIDPEQNKTEQIAAQLEDQRRRMQNAAANFLPADACLKIELEWDSDWYNSVVRASRRVQPDCLFKTTFSHQEKERMRRKTSDWTFVRECSCPVMLIRQRPVKEEPRVLAAVDMQSPKASYQALNEMIIEFAREILDVGLADVHFVNAFRDARMAPDREEIKAATGVDEEHIHIHMGEAEEVIVQKVKTLDASLVVMGHSARTGISAALAGNTVEKVLDRVECDVLSLPKPVE